MPFYDKDAKGYQEFFDTWTGKGFSPFIVSASGGGVVGNKTFGETFAGVLMKGVATYAKHGMDGTAFRDECASAKKNNFVLRCATIYGGNDTLYAAVWEIPRSKAVKWDYRFFKSMEGPELGVPVTMPGNSSLKLSFVTRSAVGEHLGVYRSDYKLDIIERHEMTLRGYSTEQNKMKNKKPTRYLPWIIQVGADPRFGTDPIDMPNVVAVFRKDEVYW